MGDHPDLKFRPLYTEKRNPRGLGAVYNEKKKRRRGSSTAYNEKGKELGELPRL